LKIHNCISYYLLFQDSANRVCANRDSANRVLANLVLANLEDTDCN